MSTARMNNGSKANTRTIKTQLTKNSTRMIRLKETRSWKRNAQFVSYKYAQKCKLVVPSRYRHLLRKRNNRKQHKNITYITHVPCTKHRHLGQYTLKEFCLFFAHNIYFVKTALVYNCITDIYVEPDSLSYSVLMRTIRELIAHASCMFL